MADIIDELGEAIGPQYVVFEKDQPRIFRFMDLPSKGQFATESGRIVDSWLFPVEEDGEPMILSVSSRRLLRILYPLLKEEKLIGHSFEITPREEGMKRFWDVEAI